MEKGEMLFEIKEKLTSAIIKEFTSDAAIIQYIPEVKLRENIKAATLKQSKLV